MMDNTLILSGVFLAVSTLFSMLGMGGGVLYVPILLFAGYSMRHAPGISLMMISATSLAALRTFSKKKMVDWKLALLIDPPTDIMSFVGGYYASAIPDAVLQGVLAATLLLAGLMMIIRVQPSETTPRRNAAWHWHRSFNGNEYTVNIPLVLTATALIGLLSGMLGITGGIIKLPIMVLICGVPMDIAVATSTVMVAVTALCGVAGHALNGTVEWRTGLALALVCAIAGTIGSRLSLNTDKTKLKRIFGVCVILIACRIAYRISHF